MAKVAPTHIFQAVINAEFTPVTSEVTSKLTLLIGASHSKIYNLM
jgi:hypothetical protein